MDRNVQRHGGKRKGKGRGKGSGTGGLHVFRMCKVRRLSREVQGDTFEGPMMEKENKG